MKIRKIVFVKDHPVGIRKGAIRTVNPPMFDKFVNEGYAEEEKPKRVRKKKVENAD
jgi:hypothetical protein